MLLVLTLGYSTGQQIAVNRLPFFAVYQVQAALAPAATPETETYFQKHLGVISSDLAAWKRGKRSFYPLMVISRGSSSAEFERLEAVLRRDWALRANFFFFPDD